MKRISVYFIDLLLIFFLYNPVNAQDTVDIPLKIRTSLEVSGPVIWFMDKNILTTEGTFSIDLNESRTALIGGGYVNYTYSQYNYSYRANGIYFKAGMDFNLMGPQKARGLYYTGIGFHYGLSRFSSEVPSFTTGNYWGTVETAIPKRSGLAHFIEATPAVRAELFRNVSIGWNINIRVLLSSGTGNDLRVLYLPGFGNAGRRISTGLSYFISWNIPYKSKRVIIMPEIEVEEEDEEVTGGRVNPANTNQGFNNGMR
jgi:hypothetical protein